MLLHQMSEIKIPKMHPWMDKHAVPKFTERNVTALRQERANRITNTNVNL